MHSYLQPVPCTIHRDRGTRRLRAMAPGANYTALGKLHWQLVTLLPAAAALGRARSRRCGVSRSCSGRRVLVAALVLLRRGAARGCGRGRCSSGGGGSRVPGPSATPALGVLWRGHEGVRPRWRCGRGHRADRGPKERNGREGGLRLVRGASARRRPEHSQLWITCTARSPTPTRHAGRETGALV